MNKKDLFTSFILLALIFTTACQNLTNVPSNKDDISSAEIVEVKNVVSDDLELKISSAFECVAMIAHLAGFDEYSGNNSNGAISRYYDYFKPYLEQPKTEAAIKLFQSLRRSQGFSYDAVASLATAMNPDCHSWRTDFETVKKNLDSRCVNPEKILKVVADFYDETNFAAFYAQESENYKKLVADNSNKLDSIVTGIEKVKSYYNTEVSKVTISFSYLTGTGNYGCSFKEGDKLFFEPKYWSNAMQNFDPGLIVHELSHPSSNPVAELLYSNPDIKNYIDKNMVGEKLKKMQSMAYGNGYIYMIELLNRANTIAIMQEFCSDEICQHQIDYDKNTCMFTEVDFMVEILQKYKTGEYEHLLEFKDVLEKDFLSKYCL